MGAEATKTYSLLAVACSYLGINLAGGFGDGDVITWEPLEPDYNPKKGADGSMVREATNNSAYRVKLIFTQTANANAILSALRKADLALVKQGIPGAALGLFVVTDLLSKGTLLRGNKTWIEAPPAGGFGMATKDREWTLLATEAESFEAGS